MRFKIPKHDTGKVKDPYKVVFYPWVKEKSSDMAEKFNKVEFVVNKKATKHQVKWAIEQIYAVKVTSVNTRNAKDGKHATITLAPEYNAWDIINATGIF